MIGHSALVTAAIESTARALSADPEVLSVPVDLDDRAVAVMAAPDLMVVKVDTDPDRVASERLSIRQLAGLLPVPEVLFATDEHPWATGLSFLRGDPIDRCTDTNAWRQAGRHLRTIHELDPSEWSRHQSHPANVEAWIDSIAEAAAADGPLSESAIKEFRRVAKDRLIVALDPCPLHGDFSTQHVLVADSATSGSIVTGLIDFGDAGIGDPAYDLAVLTLWHPERVDDVLGGYQSAATSEMQDRLVAHRLIRLAASAQWLHDREFDPTPFVVALYEMLLD